MSQEPALVLVTSSFPISGDGSEAAGAFVADLAEELGKRVAVRVVAPGNASARQPWSSNVEVFRYPTPDQPLSTLRLWHPVDAVKVLGVLRAGACAVEHAVAAGPTAHILALWALPCGEWARKSAKRNGINYSVWTLGSDIWSMGRIPVVRSRLRTILRDASHCWSDGLKLAADTRAIAGRAVDFLPSTRRVTARRSEPLRTQPPYRLLFLGRWHPNKGVDLLLDALALLSDSDWDAIERVDICGGGPLAELVHERAKSLMSAGRPICMGGYLDRSAAEAAMLAADWLLIPSRIESIPVVFSDAMKLGLPVVTTPVGDLVKLIGDTPRCGEVAVAANAAAFARVIAAAIRNDTSRYANALVDRAQRFSLDRVSRCIVEKIDG